MASFFDSPLLQPGHFGSGMEREMEDIWQHMPFGFAQEQIQAEQLRRQQMQQFQHLLHPEQPSQAIMMQPHSQQQIQHPVGAGQLMAPSEHHRRRHGNHHHSRNWHLNHPQTGGFMGGFPQEGMAIVTNPQGQQVMGLNPVPIRTPQFDVVDGPKEIIIHAELPGFKKDNLKINVQNKRLTVSGEAKSIGDDLPHHLHFKNFATFSQAWTLPDNVSEDISAKFEDGALVIKIPKIESGKSVALH